MMKFLAMSQPSWAAWIEIFSAANSAKVKLLSQPSWAAWIEMTCCAFCRWKHNLSQPSWAAWIEINNIHEIEETIKVAALLGCVD